MYSTWRIRCLTLTWALGAYFTLLTHVEAGFIFAKPETVSQNALLEADSSTSKPSPHTPIPHRVNRAATETAPSSGMSSPTTVVTHSVTSAYASNPTYQIDLSPHLTTRLSQDNRVWLPPPFSTGIFRPPRYLV